MAAAEVAGTGTAEQDASASDADGTFNDFIKEVRHS